MPLVTSLQAQKNDPERVNVYVDGEFSFGASALVVLQRGLHTGMELSARDVEELKRADSVDRAYNACLNFLSFRPRSRREVEDYLRRRKVDPDASLEVVQRLERAGLLDDREFARFWVENRQAFRPRGSRALRMEMRQKGVPGEVIDETLEDLPDEEAAAYAAAQPKIRSLERLEEREFTTRLIAFLQRRGFPYSASSAAVRRILEERNAEVPDDLTS